MPVSRYGVAKGRITTLVGPSSNGSEIHTELRLDLGEDHHISAMVNVMPQPGDPELLFWNYIPYEKPHIQDKLDELPPGLHIHDEDKFPALDYIRGSLLTLNNAITVPVGVTALSELLSKSSAQWIAQGCDMCIYGSFHDGWVRNIHMNQGSSDQFAHENGTLQDGGILLKFPDGRWEAIFIAFSSQALETDETGQVAGFKLREAYTPITTRDGTALSGDTTMLTSGKGPDTEASDIICQRATSCRSLFRQCLQFQSLSGGDFLEITFAKFSWWSVAIGAEKRGISSLDHRVGSRSDIRSALVRFLDILRTSLKRCIDLDTQVRSSANAEDIGIIQKTKMRETQYYRADIIYIDPPRKSILGEQFSYIEISVKYLAKLSEAILQSGTGFRHERADKELESRQEQLKPFREGMFRMIQIETRKGNDSGNMMLAEGTEFLGKGWRLNPAQERLIEANILRKNRFDVYSQDFERISNVQVNNMEELASKKPGQATMSHTFGNIVEAKAIGRAASRPSQQHVSHTKVTQSSQEATELAPSLKIPRTTAMGQEIFPGPALSQVDPSFPKGPSEDGKGVWCPYCAQALDFTSLDPNYKRKWHAHIMEDIGPYVCIYPECPRPISDCMYVHIDEWKQHLRQSHSSPSWVCDFCFRDALDTDWVQFHTRRDWMEHIKALHQKDVVNDTDLETIEAMSRTSTLFPVDCPVCGVRSNPLDTGTDNHIASHLHSFALLSLPGRSDTNVSSGKTPESPPNTLLPAVQNSISSNSETLGRYLSTVSRSCQEITAQGSKHKTSLHQSIEILDTIVKRLRRSRVDTSNNPKSIISHLEVLVKLLSDLRNIEVGKEDLLYTNCANLISATTDELNDIIKSAVSPEPGIESSKLDEGIIPELNAATGVNKENHQQQGTKRVNILFNDNTGLELEEVKDDDRENSFDLEDTGVGVKDSSSGLAFTGMPSEQDYQWPPVTPAEVTKRNKGNTLRTPAQYGIASGNQVYGTGWGGLGIDDPRVERCHDRGNHFFDQDVPMPSRRRPTSASLASHNWMDLTAELSNDLFESVENPIWGGANTNFLPRRKFRNIVTPERVRAIVASLPTFNNRDLEDFVQTAFHGRIHNGKQSYPSVKLFATLVCCDAVDRYPELVSRGISDICLPPVYDKTDYRGPLKCKGLSCGSEHVFLENFPNQKRKVFYEWAYSLNAPYFRRPKFSTSTPGAPTESLPQALHHHYILSDDDILPIVSSREQEPGTSTRMSRQRNSTSGSSDTQEGGFSTVTRVQFHPDHFDFGSQDGQKYEFFALKKLTTPDQRSFSNEIASLLAFISNDNEHLVKLLTSFEIQRRGRSTEFYLLFPWADGTLWDCWKLNDAVEKRANLPQWMSHQCYQLAKALQVFHNERRNQLRRQDIEEDERQFYGRHGDVKAENILWFKDQKQKTAAYLGRLVLNDFGVVRLNSKMSWLTQNPSGMPRTKTYEAPDFDLPGSMMSRVSDIFSLGCAFLEFTTWIVEGIKSADFDFTEARMEADPQNPAFKLDTFFKLVDGPGGDKVPVIKPKVKGWIQRLGKHPNCTQFIADFLELIEEHMIKPNPKERWESDRVVKRLWELRQSCRTDTTYWKDPINVKHEKDTRKAGRR